MAASVSVYPAMMPRSMTRAQWDALPPHLKLSYSAYMPHGSLLGNRQLPLPRSMQTHQYRMFMDRAKAKRPLNSWMAFRSFYSRIFISLPQKKASPLLTMLWASDPFKAKWSIIARAWSTMRDVLGKQFVNLEGFLNLICPVIGVLPYEVYLEEMRWQVTYDAEGNASVLKTAMRALSSFPDFIRNTMMSDLDVITFCANRGFISEAAARFIHNVPVNGLGLTAGQHLIASAALTPYPISTPEEFHQVSQIDPEYAASVILGFDVSALLTPENEASVIQTDPMSDYTEVAGVPIQYQWTGSNAEIYEPLPGNLNLEVVDEDLARQFDISEPSEFDYALMSETLYENGHIIPAVPDMEMREYIEYFPQ